MYAIIETGGKQYRVAPGDKVKVEKLNVEVGNKVIFDKVHLFQDDAGVVIGKPIVEGVTVSATVNEIGKDKKVIVFKYKNKTNQRRFRGHRQSYSVVTIDSINKA